MSYVALYRKWRPGEFDQVKGQDHIVTTLKNQITHNRIGHAYLFCGTRGTGKTTVAKLFAKAVNCEHPLEDGSPCNACAMCKAIGEGSSMNVIEIDAASNNGVDNIREIKDEVQYSPTEGKYKVYIIDEVHMLSIGAFNALLKTLEEPPAYVIFILATTESHKIPITILSRCQRYDFRRISLDVIADRLSDLIEREQVQAEEKAIRYIAKAADGSMRDALSLLDQCIAFYLGETLTYEKVLDVLGAVDTQVFGDFMERIINQDVVAAIDMIDDMLWQGRELLQFVTDFTWYMRNLLLIKSAEHGIDKLDFSKENKEQMQKMADKLSMEVLMRYIRVFSEVSGEMKYASQKRVVLELAVIKLCKPQMEKNYDSILQRLTALEEQMEAGVPLAPRQPAGREPDEEDAPFDFEEEVKKKLPPADVEELKTIIRKWHDIMLKVPSPADLHLEKASVNVGENGHSLNLVFQNNGDDNLAYQYFQRSEKLNELKEIIGQVTGREVELQCFERKVSGKTTIDNFNLTKLNFDVEYED